MDWNSCLLYKERYSCLLIEHTGVVDVTSIQAQISRVKEEDSQKTAFRVHNGLFEFKVMRAY